MKIFKIILLKCIEENASNALTQDEFNRELWVGLLEKALVGEKDITFVFRNGSEVKIEA